MNEYLELIKVVANLGVGGLALAIFGWLANRWAGKFLEAQQGQTSAMVSQAKAMESLAQTVRDGQGEQREVLLAVRVMATKLDEVRSEIRNLEADIREGVSR